MTKTTHGLSREVIDTTLFNNMEGITSLDLQYSDLSYNNTLTGI